LISLTGNHPEELKKIEEMKKLAWDDKTETV